MKIGISACLLGAMCRYDGKDAKDKFIVNTLGEYFDYEAFCPEADVFGTPRDTIRLVEIEGEIRVQTSFEGIDLTEKLDESSEKNALKIKDDRLCGFILKSNSPTCGMERVKVYQKVNAPSEKKGVGRFAAKIKEKYPFLPMEEEGRLLDPWLRENFLMQIFAYKHLHEFMDNNPTLNDLIKFHTQYKYLIYAKSHIWYKTLGKIVANSENKSLFIILEEYKLAFVQAINEKGNINKTYNVLLHIFGYFKKLITKEEKKEILEFIEDYKEKLIPLIAVVNILNLYTKRFSLEYLLSQKFLNPYPKDFSLRSDVKAYK